MASFQVQVASIMEVLAKTAVAEINKLVDDGSAVWRLEMCRSQRENEALKTKLLLMEGELRAVRGYGEGTPGISLNLSFEVEVCNESREAQTRTSGAAAANGGEEPLCKEEELHMQPCPAGDPEKELQAEVKQEREEQPLTPTLPLLESAELGLQIQSVWSEANGLEISQERNRPCRRSSEHGDARLDRTRSVKDEGSASHLEQKQNGRPQEKKRFYGPPDEVSGKSPCRTEGQEEFICTRCGKTFPDTLELKTHEQQHSAGKRFSCSECSKGFTSSSVLEKHELVHSREKPFTCSVCDKSFSQSHVLQAHKRTHTGQKPYACVECGKCFSCKDLLKSHQCVHTREKPFTCEQCGRRFARKSSLKIHQVTHTGEKCFSCPVCNKSFGYLHVLKQHQSVHTGEKPHYCKQCGKCFSQTSTLKTHQRVHTREKPFSCKWCGKCFSQISTLNTHQVTHTGERPHRCNECGKSFAHRGNLKSHQRVHTGWNNVQLHTVQQEVLPESLQNNSVPTSRGVLCNVFGTN